MTRFADPWILLLVPLVAVLFWDARRRGRERKPAVGYSDLTLVRWSAAARPVWEDHLPLALAALALALLLFALARPQAGLTAEDVTSRGIDIMLCLDTSGSMAAEDLRPNRLGAARQVSMEFVRERPQDRLGLVVFGSIAFTQCPLTTDHDALLTLLDSARIGMTKTDATAIGTALATAVNRLKDTPGKSKVIVLVTDGRNNTGEIDPITAAKLAAQFGIRIYPIGVGTHGAAPVTQVDQFGIAHRMVIGEDLDEPTLTRIADLTGGKFYRATDTESLAGIFREVNKLEKTTRTAREFVEYRELYPWFLVPGLVLLVLGAGLERTLLQEVP